MNNPYLNITVSDLQHDRLQDQRQVLHTAAEQLQPGLASAPAETWLTVAALCRLQAQVERQLNSSQMAEAYLEQADDCERHAYRLLTGNDGPSMKHLEYLASQARNYYVHNKTTTS